MADVVVLGTAAADIVIRVVSLPRPGDHVSATGEGWRLGGGAVNFACGVAAAGLSVELIGPFGDDRLADRLAALVQQQGVGTGRSFRVHASSPRALLLLDDRGERTILSLDQELAQAAYPLAEAPPVSDARCVWVETYARFPVTVAERAGDALVVTGPPAVGAGAWPADIVIGSERQLPSAWGPEPFGPIRRLAGDRLQWVVVTRGASGADAYGPTGALHVDARPARQVDTTGAGDGFAAAMVAALLGDLGMEKALERGAVAGAAAVQVLQSVPPASGLLDDP